MGLSLRNDNVSWGGGSIIILWILGFLISYVPGRLLYFSILVTIITNRSVTDQFENSMLSVSKRINVILEEIKNGSITNRIGYQFKQSFKRNPIAISLVLGFLLAITLYSVGWFVLK
jgi:hypothetical protein